MKTQILFSMMFTLVSFEAAYSKQLIDQACSGDVTLSSQAEVDAFSCTEVEGDLTISGSDITNLNSLATLTKVSGSLIISDNTVLTSLDGLSALNTVGGRTLILNNSGLLQISGFPALRLLNNGQDLRISDNNNLKSVNGFNNLIHSGSIEISNNPSLVGITGFNSLIKTDNSSFHPPGTLTILNNEALTMLDGFAALEIITHISIDNNKSLTRLDGFPSLTTIIGFLEITNNSTLQSINGFSKLTSITTTSRSDPDGGLRIIGNPVLESFKGLSSLKSIRAVWNAEVSIIDNASIKNIDGLSSLTTFFALEEDKRLNISNNASLKNLDGLSSLTDVPEGPGQTYISVTGNPMLMHCCGLQPMLDALSFSGTLLPSVHTDISQNGAGCTLQDIMSCGSHRVLGFTLLNQRTHDVMESFQDGMTIDLADPKFSYLMLQANTTPERTGSVEFIFDEHTRITENGFPYQVILPQFLPGTHTVRTEVYSRHHKMGEKGIGRTATFNVINSAVIISINLVNQSGEQLMNLSDGDEVNINDPDFKNFLFRASPLPDRVDKVEFYLNDHLVGVEYGFPYEAYGNSSPGDYTLKAIPYIKIRGNQYVPGTSMKVSFKVVSENTGTSRQASINDQSNVGSLQQTNETAGILLFPVPVDNELFVKIDDSAGKNAVLTIRNIHGILVYQDSYEKSQRINTLDLKTGVYYLHVTGANGFLKVIKFIKR